MVKILRTDITIADSSTGEVLGNLHKDFQNERDLFENLDKWLSSFKRGIWKSDTLSFSALVNKVPDPIELNIF